MDHNFVILNNYLDLILKYAHKFLLLYSNYLWHDERERFSNNLFPNIIYLSGFNSKDIKIDNIRNLKSLINKKTLIEKERFIILDDIEIFNLNSLNALLKTLEEPTINNYFILINNLSNPLIDTIRSRALEIKVFLNNQEQIQIIEALSNKYNIQCILDFKKINLTPGNFFIFNQICIDNKIDIHDDYLKNISLLFTLYKKDKNFDFINMAIFLTNYYFYNINKKDKNIEKLIDDKSFIINNINKLILYNLNYKSVVQAINNRILNE